MTNVPYNWSPEPHQLQVIRNSSRFKVIVWHRKAHKTTLGINELIRWADAIPGTYWYIAPFLNQARKIVWQDPEMLEKYCPPELWKKRNNTELYIPFPNGSMLYVLGADHPDALRGPNPRGVVLDEYDDMKPEIWSAIIQPVMTANPKAWCWFMGTYKGRLDLWKKHAYASAEMQNAELAKKKSDWYAILLKASQSGIISKEALEEAKRTTSEAYYLQEYECEAIDNAAQFFTRIEQNLWDGNLIPEKGKRYQMGVDLAKFQDWTVVTPFDLTSFRVGIPERFNQVDYTYQKARIEAAYLRYFKAKITLDSTGVGEPIYDDLKARGMKIEPFVFTEKSKEDLLMNLKLLIENGKIKIPNDETVLNELRAFQYRMVLSPNRRPRITVQVPEGMTDDCVMSMALAVWQIPDRPVQSSKQSELELLQEFDYYRLQPKRGRSGYGLTGSRYLNK